MLSYHIMYLMLTIIAAAVGYNSGYGQPSYGTQQPTAAAYGQQQQPYAQQQSYGYEAYNTAGRQGSDPQLINNCHRVYCWQVKIK